MANCVTCKAECIQAGTHIVEDNCVCWTGTPIVLVRRGEWTTDREIANKPVWSCSECTYQTLEKTPYCPMCGAKME